MDVAEGAGSMGNYVFDRRTKDEVIVVGGTYSFPLARMPSDAEKQAIIDEYNGKYAEHGIQPLEINFNRHWVIGHHEPYPVTTCEVYWGPDRSVEKPRDFRQEIEWFEGYLAEAKRDEKELERHLRWLRKQAERQVRPA